MDSVYDRVAAGMSVAGSVVIVWGMLVSLFSFVRHEIRMFANMDSKREITGIYDRFGNYLILGLDFMMAADIIHTVHRPVLDELYVLAIIVAIRTVISYFLHRELNRTPVSLPARD